MDKKIIFTVVEQNDVLHGKANAKYECTINEERMILTNLKDSKDSHFLYLAYFDVVKFVIYRNKVCLKAYYDNTVFFIKMETNEWAEENSIYFLKCINRYAPVLFSEIYYDIIYNKKSISKAVKTYKTATSEEFFNKLEYIVTELDMENNEDVQDLAVNLMIDTYDSSSNDDKDKDESLGNIISFMDTCNEDLRYSNLILFYICKRIAVIDKDKVEDLMNYGLKIAKEYIKEHNNTSDMIYYYSYFQTISFYGSKNYEENIKNFAEPLINDLKEMIKDNPNYYIYKDLRNFAENYFFYLGADGNNERTFNLYSDIVSWDEKIVELNPCWRNKFKLASSLDLLSNLYLEVKEDYLSAKECVLKKEKILKEILDTFKPIKNENAMYLYRDNNCAPFEREEVLASLSISYYELALLSSEYGNYHEFVKNMNKHLDLEIYLFDETDFFEDEEQAGLEILHKADDTINTLMNNDYENIDDVREIALKFGDLAEKLNKAYDTLEFNMMFLHVLYNYEMLFYHLPPEMLDEDTSIRRANNFLEVYKLSKKIIEKDNKCAEAYEAYVFSAYMIFLRSKENSVEVAKECAQNVVDNFDNIDEQLRELDGYQEIKNECIEYLKTK